MDGEISFTSSEPVHVGQYVDVTITSSEGADLCGTSHSAVRRSAPRT